MINGQSISKIERIFINLGDKLNESGKRIIDFADKGVTNPSRKVILVQDIARGFDEKAELTLRVKQDAEYFSCGVVKYFTNPPHSALD